MFGGFCVFQTDERDLPHSPERNANASRVASGTPHPPSASGLAHSATSTGAPFRFPHVRCIKEAGGSVDRVDQLKQAMGSDITVLSGDDSLTLPFMAVGAEGVISVASNLYAKKVTRMVACALAGDFATAGRLHRELYPMFRGIFAEPNPGPIKIALADHGVIGSAEVRPPLCEMSTANLRVLRELLARIKV